ncbi:MFS transporter [Streptomyces sp. B-S-A8]|uniref:MFS transporter n=1 Tax=Streptomyces solicavernae TaxID=3043614 RepID=A0ABT6S2U4_9ACTN|nr:MFS transporter [Streptomyces sp. B-S-A8]MDI3390338.1 MFS transporter [Streptomyces sp. B-S-A8]
MRSPFAGTFQSLTIRNFRLFAAGQLVSVAGTWMMVVAQDWLVLSMTDDSASALGVVTALQFAPLLLLSLHAGGLADRHDKRRLLLAANIAAGLLALLLGLLVLSGVAGLWHVFAFALALGIVNAVEVPARMSFVSELVGPELLPNASALSAAYFNSARVLGPALAGLLIGWLGSGPVMLLNAVSYLATVVGLRLMRPAELHRSARRPRRAPVMDGIRHLTARRDLLLPMFLVAVVGMLGLNFQLTLPLMAKSVFHSDATGFGLLTAVFAAGGLLAAFVTTRRRGRPTAGLVVGAAFGFGVVEAAAGFAPTYATAAVLLFGAGFGSLYFAQAANHRIQLGTDPAYRGRVLAVYTLIFQGTTPLGALLVGALSEAFGPRSGLITGGAASALAAAVVLLGQVREVPPASRRPAHGSRRTHPSPPAIRRKTP